MAVGASWGCPGGPPEALMLDNGLRVGMGRSRT